VLLKATIKFWARVPHAKKRKNISVCPKTFNFFSFTSKFIRTLRVFSSMHKLEPMRLKSLFSALRRNRFCVAGNVASMWHVQNLPQIGVAKMRLLTSWNCDRPKIIHKFTSPSPFRSVKSAALSTAAGHYQAVRWQQEPKYIYNLSTPTVSCKMFVCSNGSQPVCRDALPTAPPSLWWKEDCMK
jgi:hypothetical protein